MHKNTIVHGVLTLVSVAGLTFLVAVQAEVRMHPFSVSFYPPERALGYGETLTSLCSNLEGYWKFDERSGSQALDISENDHHGTLQNMDSTNRTTDVPSVIGFRDTGSLMFDGSQESVTVAASSALRIAGDITLSLWIKYDALASAASGNALIAHGTAGENAAENILYLLSIRSDKKLRMQWESGAGTDTAVESSEAASIVSGEWKHVAVSRDAAADTVRFYMSGSLVGTAQSYTDDASGGASGSLVIGASPDATQHFDGKIDDVRVYTAVLTGGQVLALARGSDVYAGCSCGNSVVESPETCDNGGSNSNTAANACRTNCRAASCGDGVEDTGEECDDGGSNSDTAANACRTTCEFAACGDGVIDGGETCDNGSLNSNTTANACRTDCTPAACGDSVVDSGETCDDGNNVNTDSCSNSCTTSTCGDEIIQSGEECDDGDQNSDTVSNACRTTCELPACGDGVTDLGETCDAGAATALCDTDCTVPVCGDGVANTVAGEQCDNGDENSDSAANACRTDCSAAACGDGVADTGESCDDGDSDNLDSCTNVCRNASCGDGHIQASNNETCEPPNTATCASNCTGVTGGGGSGSRRSRSTSGIVSKNTTTVTETIEKREPPPAGCGNRITERNKGEECDEGNKNGEGSCSYNCKILFCGDGVVSPEIYEDCEPEPIGTLNGVKQFVQPVCGLQACTAPTVDAVTGRVTGGCKRLFLSACPGEAEKPAAPEAEESTLCGNGDKDENEECDDGNTEGNDGCSSDCREERCGDGEVQGEEDCDNGSVCSNDREKLCASDLDCGKVSPCKDNGKGKKTCDGEENGDECESDFDCSAFGKCEYDEVYDSSCSNACEVTNGCGDGTKDDGEECDDGNTAEGDGCDSFCKEEAAPRCGDGKKDKGEECDDGNTDGGDGCAAACKTEKFCGDAKIDEGEECDDGNAEDGDGCSVLCTVEPLESSEPSASQNDARASSGAGSNELAMDQRLIVSLCGNRLVEAGEQCDDGDRNSSSMPNACRADCTLPRCGDGVADRLEQCDMGAMNSASRPDSCRSDCRLPRCGDGVVDSNEDCDGGLTCRSDCRFALSARCGNGSLEAGEACDDGNTSGGDGCSASCGMEPKVLGVAVCGNRVRERSEACDDGNLLGGDGCSANCTVEPLQLRPAPQAPEAVPATQVAGESASFGSAPSPVPVAGVRPTAQRIARETPASAPVEIVMPVAAQEPRQQVVVPQQATQYDYAAWQANMLNAAYYQQWLQYHLAQQMPGSLPEAHYAVAGETGPEAVVIVSGGAAVGLALARRRKKRARRA